MYAYEVLYRENGILKHKGFKYRDQFDRFLSRMSKRADTEIIDEKINVKE